MDFGNIVCAKFQDNLATEKWVMDKCDFTRFEFQGDFRENMIYGAPWALFTNIDWF